MLQAIYAEGPNTKSRNFEPCEKEQLEIDNIFYFHFENKPNSKQPSLGSHPVLNS